MQYGRNFTERHELEDGTTVVLRVVQPSDRDEFDRQFRRMSPDSRYRRFFTGLRELSPEMLDYLTIVDGHDHFAVIALVESLDLKAEEGVGVARFVRLRPHSDVAEAAVTVVDDYQGRGLGRILLLALVGAAQERGVKKFRGEVLADNEPMRRLLEAAGAVGEDHGDGSLVFDVPIDTVEDSVMRRILSAVATSMAVWLSRLYPGERPGAKT